MSDSGPSEVIIPKDVIDAIGAACSDAAYECGVTDGAFNAVIKLVGDAIRAAVLAEREACAALAESHGAREPVGWGGGPADTANAIAAAILARK